MEKLYIAVVLTLSLSLSLYAAWYRIGCSSRCPRAVQPFSSEGKYIYLSVYGILLSSQQHMHSARTRASDGPIVCYENVNAVLFHTPQGLIDEFAYCKQLVHRMLFT